MTFASRWLLPVVLIAAACKPEPSADEVGDSDTSFDTGSESTIDGTDVGTDEAETSTDTDVDTSTDADTTDTDPGECGNGTVEGDEECDDGNQVAGDGCNANCQTEGPAEPLECSGTIYQCGDTIDNDEDGLIDLDDPECISPCDDNEASFQTDLPGQNNDCKGDCYFDENSGGGDDKCEWNLQCDSENPGAQVGCEYDPDLPGGMCALEMPPECLEFCVPLVPNGCDCFGCCEIEGQFVYLDSSPDCTLENLAGCESCTFYDNCNNPCVPEECELCFGQDPDDLPDECDMMPSCPEGVQSCLDDEDCPEGDWCQTGCCAPIDIP